jgi:hypothetical protein
MSLEPSSLPVVPLAGLPLHTYIIHFNAPRKGKEEIRKKTKIAPTLDHQGGKHLAETKRFSSLSQRELAPS